MKIARADERQWQRFASHRKGLLQNKRLLSGTEGLPDNYELSIVDVAGDYETPPHRHNFDQIRFQLVGSFGYGKADEDVQEEGSIGYFPEGTPYAQRSVGHCRTLLLQFGGNSGAGFMSYAQLERGQAKLLERGNFAHGKFQENSGSDEAAEKDAYEAIWEEVNGRRIEYPQPRYRAPIIATPESFGWVPLPGQEGCTARACGSFGERAVGFGFIAVEPSRHLALLPHRLYYVVSGTGNCGDEPVGEGCAIDPDGGTDLVVQAVEPLVLVYLDRPSFGEESGAVTALPAA
jgi:hypothetical protein